MHKVIALLRHVKETGSDGHLLRYICKAGSEATLVAAANGGESERTIFKLVPTCHVKLSGVRIKFGQRIFEVVTQLVALIKLRVFEAAIPAKLFAGSQEKALLLQLVFPKAAKKFYLFSDLTRFHMSPTTGPFIRLLEKHLIRRGWIPCITSPGFYFGYLKDLNTPSNPLLVHNIEPAMTARVNEFPKLSEQHRIAWFGLLRCNTSLIMLKALVETGMFHLEMAGLATGLSEAEFNRLIASRRTRFHGGYLPTDLENLYSNATLTWACDWSSSEIVRPLDNSDLLLPNRLYQGICAGTPIIASKGSWTGKVVTYYKIGIEIDSTPESAIAEVLGISAEYYSEMQSNIIDLARSTFFSLGPWEHIEIGKACEVSKLVDIRNIFEAKCRQN